MSGDSEDSYDFRDIIESDSDESRSVSRFGNSSSRESLASLAEASFEEVQELRRFIRERGSTFYINPAHLDLEEELNFDSDSEASRPISVHEALPPSDDITSPPSRNSEDQESVASEDISSLPEATVEDPEPEESTSGGGSDRASTRNLCSGRSSPDPSIPGEYLSDSSWEN